jgi:hypothetical protein
VTTPPYEPRDRRPGEHPVEHFWAILDQLGSADYPSGVVPLLVEERLPGTAFFSAGAGLVRRRGERLPEFPAGGVMFVGHNLDAEEPYRRRVLEERDHGDPDRPSMATWRNMYAMLRLGEVDRAEVFFTNYFVGLKAGKNPNGAFPGKDSPSFLAWCEAFLDEQIRVMRPRVVIALGTWTQGRLGMHLDTARVANRAGVEFRAGGMTHPSYPRYYERLGEERRIDLQAAFLRSLL